MALLTDPNAWLGLMTLSLLEIILGIDNIIFIAVLAGRLPPSDRERARRVGLAVAFGSRVALLFAIGWLAGLTAPVFSLAGHPFSGRDVLLIVGGIFLIVKATREIHEKLEGHQEASPVERRSPSSFGAVIGQIALIDIVFSLDSVVTAVGMVSSLAIMVAANAIALAFMLGFSGYIAAFVEKHPTVKMLALSFLIMIGANLVADGFGHHLPKGYTYFAMAFSVAVEMLNLRVRARKPSG